MPAHIDEFVPEKPEHDILLGLNQTHTISLFGVQGGGKSYIGSIIEMATLSLPGINCAFKFLRWFCPTLLSVALQNAPYQWCVLGPTMADCCELCRACYNVYIPWSKT